MVNHELQNILDSLKVLLSDQDTSKRFKEKTEKVISILNSDSNLAIEKALLEMDEINSLEMTSYLRTQVWDLVSMLESLKN